MANKVLIYVLLIFLGAIIIRSYRLNEIPVGFHGDEVNIAYNAWSIKETGKDVNGNFLPIVINQWGDYRAVGYYYFAALSFLIFGLSDFATRFPSAFFGSVSVVFIWLIADKLYNRYIAWISAIVLAIFPWHIIISRSTSESVISLAFVLMGVISGIKALHTFKPIKWTILSLISFFISFITYHAARYSIPIFLLGVCIFMLKHYDLQKRTLLISFTLLVCAISFLLYITSGSVRASQTSIFTFPETKFILEESIREDGKQNPLYTRLWHNKLISYSNKALENGLQHLSSSYLIFGNFMPSRYLAGKATLMPLWMYGLFFIGISVVITDLFTKKNKQSIMLLWALVSSMVPAAFTFEDIPNVQRSSLLIPLLVLFVSIGIYRLMPLITGKYRIMSIFIFTLIVAYASGQFVHEYFNHGITHKTWYRNSGEKELVLFLDTIGKKREKAFVTASADNSEIFYFWYLRINPKIIHLLPKSNRLKEIFPTFTFLPIDCFGEGENNTLLPNYLYVSLGDCKNVPNTQVAKVIMRDDGTEAFKIFRVNSN